MSDFGSARLENELDALADEHPHLREHLEWFHEEYGEYPKLIDEPSEEWESDRPNVIYEAEAPIFCHVYGDMGIDTTYYCVEPTLEDEDKALYDRIRQRILDKSVTRPAPGDNEEFEEHLDELLDEVVEITSGITGQSIGRLKSFGTSKVSLSQDQFTRLRYQLQRDIVGLGPLEPVMADTANEDIHVIGPKQCYLDHGTYGMISATVDFGTPEEFEQWLRNMGERMNHPISDSDPIIDATLPGGSRINIIYSDDVSVQGPSMTIRQGEEIPLSVFQITKWGTISPELAAYLWLCLENEQTVFVVGETASGKTDRKSTRLNSSHRALSRMPSSA